VVEIYGKNVSVKVTCLLKDVFTSVYSVSGNCFVFTKINENISG
jgi:hypothetical protein